MNQSSLQKNSGYTLLETLVAILILTLAVVAPMTIASRSLFSSTVAQQQVTAFTLAQEAIEGVRNVRDHNGLSGSPWLSSFPSLGTNFTIDAVNTITVGGDPIPTMATCSGTCAPINYDTSSHLYQYSPVGGTNAATDFVRTVRMDAVAGTADEVQVSVTVTWNVGNLNRSFTARENIFNWQ